MPGFRKQLIMALAVLTPVAAFAAKPQAQEAAPAAAEAVADGLEGEVPMTPEEEEAADKAFLTSLGFKEGGSQVKVGSNAVVDVPADFMAADARGTKQFLEATRNLPNGRELATLIHTKDKYFIIFEFDSVGYVKDDDKDELDADAMLKNIREGQIEANKILAQRGDPQLEVTGWHSPPHYDEASHNLEWAPLLKDLSNNDISVNYNVRILGRRGVMEAQLVASPDQMAAALPALRGILKRFEFVKGEDYASFNADTDKVAEYGLAALVLGGAGAVAAKSGLLGRLLKPLLIAGAALIAAFGSFFKKIFGRGN